MKYAQQLAKHVHLKITNGNLVSSLNAVSSSPNQAQIEEKTLFVPANISSTALIDILIANPDSIIITESEIETITNILKQDWGSHADFLLKGFHFEKISKKRKEKAIGWAYKPRMSYCISGTLLQYTKLIPSAANGLFSRFIHYTFDEPPKWKPFMHNTTRNLDANFELYSKELAALYQFLLDYPTEIRLTVHQWQKLDQFFEEKVNNKEFQNIDLLSGTIMRLSNIAYRILMIVSSLKKAETGIKDLEITVNDHDVDACLELIEVYWKHAYFMIGKLPLQREERENLQSKFYKLIPAGDVPRKVINELGKKLLIPERTITDWLNKWISKDKTMISPKYGVYQKRPD